MKKSLIILIAALSLCAGACGEKQTPVIIGPGQGGNNGPETPTDAEIGKVLPAWKEGEFDIHFINTTTGESIYLIFPDGTQMLIDAAGSQASTGNVGSTTNTGIRGRWDPTREGGWHTGTYIEQYIRSCQKWLGEDKLDYVLLTHFHNDHFGGANGLPASDKSSTYTKQSLPYIMDRFRIGKLLDRGYPDYNYPFDMATQADNASNCKNYITAVKWHVANNGLKVEKFTAGSNTQIVPVRNAAGYANFSVRNIAANGEFWTGSGTATKNTFPALGEIVVADSKNVQSSDKCPEENHCSCMAKFSYGKFDFFAGGDAQYDGVSTYSWKDVETPAANACGRVDVMKADHHGTANTNGYNSKVKAMATFNPQCWIVNSWTDGHPRATTFEELTTNLPSTDIFITNTCSTMTSYKNWGRVKGQNGHFVVRVAEGGDSYYVYTLSDSDRKATVTSINGPYSSK